MRLQHISNLGKKIASHANPLILTTGLLIGVLSPILAITGTAHANINNTRADAWGTQEVAGSSWLNGGGVDIYSNGSQAIYSPAKPNNYVNGVLSGEEWQCVELVNRLYLTKGWITSTWVGYGYQMYVKASSVGLSGEQEGSITYLNPGDVITLATVSGDGSPGHVGIVNSVTQNGSSYSVNVANQNTVQVYFTATLSGGTLTLPSGWSSGYTVTGVTHHPGSTTTSNIVQEVKKLTQSDGTNEVVRSKSTDVNESWWNSTSNGIQVSSLIHISQADIQSFDISLYSNGEHDLFVATAHNIWEVWWYPGQGLHTTEILANIGNIKKIIKSVGPDGVTQQLYVMTDTGAYEYWWNSTSNGIQHGTIMTLANPVDEYKEIEPDGSQALFIADQNYPYEQHWGAGINGIQQTTFSTFSGITSISFSQSAGKHRLYIGASSGAIWEASWQTGGSIGYWYLTGGSPVVQLQKWEDDSEQVLYEATSGGVFEYYWPTGTTTLGSDIIKGSLSSVHSFVRSTDTGGVQSVYTATGTNILESWWIPGGNGITTGTIE